MAARNNIFTTIRTEGALLPADLLQRISERANIDGLTPESYHRPGEKLNEVINRSWNALQGAWASFRAAQERLPENDLGTTITRERWLLPLFRELDYGRLQTATAVEIDGRTYPISHSWEHVPIHLVSYKLELDRRTPGAAGAASASPHSLLQVFLNRSADSLWGFLSNGYKLRILRDNVSLTRQAYVEFDLEAMMEGEVYSDFVLLWLLCHQSRVEAPVRDGQARPSECWLEKWMKVAEEQGTRALDQLRDGVEQAIEALGVGFLEYHANAALRDKLTSGELNAQDYYHQLLRMVYRLLFLFVAEDRDLLLNPDAPQAARERYMQFYSTRRLRRMAETFKGTRHPDLFEGLRLVMRLLSGEALTPNPSPEGRGEQAGAGLGLVPLGSFLFSDGAVSDVIDCQISNQHLLTAVRALSLTYDKHAKVYRTVDYKNLGSDELGSIFESLLELHPQINVPARRFELAKAAGNERKTTGSYYTPESLVHALLDSALNPVLEAAIRPSPPKSPSPSGRGGLKVGSPEGDHLDKPSPSGRGGLKQTAEQEAQWRARANEVMQQVARNLRQRQTPAETILWEALRDRRLDGLKFRRQHAIANTAYVADFLCYEARLIVEIDGGIHETQREDDAIRQQNIEAEGFTVIRFTNDQIYQDFESVLTEILTTARTKAPLPEGEGLGVRVNTTPEQRILALKVCDPACGSGHFLIAAANRMAKALAFVRTGEEEPPPAALQEAKRDIISHCIYGVDINPMAVELCKVNLWMEALEPGKPLSFLDHRILVGNSLLGTTPKLMAGGIPDDAFSPIEGDDREVASALRKMNRQERKARETGQRSMFEQIDPPADYARLAQVMHALDDTPDDTLDAVRRKEQQYAALASDPEYVKARLLADAWCAAFMWEKKPSPPQPPSPSGRGGSSSLLPEGEALGMRVPPPPMTDLLYRRMEKKPLADDLRAVREYVVELKERYQFFHWHVAFPDVFTLTLNPSPSGRGTSERDRLPPRPEGEGGGNAIRQHALGALPLRPEGEGGGNAIRQHALGALPLRPEGEGGGNAIRQHALGALPLRPEGEGGWGDEGFNAQTGWHGGFDVVLGNPPWERIKIQEKEWFAERAPEIASAPNAADRKRMINALKQSDPYLYADFLADLRKAEGESHFVRASGRFPLCGRGDVNTYSLFAEIMRQLIHGGGRAGVIVPSGIATDDTTKFFFQDLMRSRSLVSLYDFENRKGLFPAVDSRVKFCLLTLRGGQTLTPVPSPSGRGEMRSEYVAPVRHRGPSPLGREEMPRGGQVPPHEGQGFSLRAEAGQRGQDAEFAFFLHHPDELRDPERVFTLSAEDIALINPNTGTVATFRNVRDAEITKAIYRRVPVLIKEPSSQTLLPEGEGLASPPRPEGEGDLGGEGLNPWGISFLRMFDMSNDSHLFRTRDELEAAGFALQGNHFVRGDERYLPLYEAKMMHQFTHRWATYTALTLNPSLKGRGTSDQADSPLHLGEGQGVRDFTPDELRDPHALSLPRYWVDAREVAARLDTWDKGWLLGFRDIARSTDKRTAIFGLLPRVAVGHVMPLIYFSELDKGVACFAAGFNTFVFDYNSRQKIGGTHLTYGYLKQLPVIPPHTYTPALLDFIVPRVLELTYTAWDMQPFAQDVGYYGAPFIWDEERRFLMRCELDALYFHLYQISRDDVDYIMETFPIVKRDDMAAYGTYRTKDTILEMYDSMAALPAMHVPAPKASPHPPAPSPSGRGGEKVPPPEGEGFRVGVTYLVPDVSQWQTWLNPPPADPRVAHPDDREQ
jgi:very-short-patch-repair endonuclease